MNIGPTPEFISAFEEVFGLPATPDAVLGAIRAGDPRIDEVRWLLAEMAEDKREEEANELSPSEPALLFAALKPDTTRAPAGPPARRGRFNTREEQMNDTPTIADRVLWLLDEAEQCGFLGDASK